MNKLMMHWLFKWYIYISALILVEPLENEAYLYFIQYYLCSSKISHILGDLWETKYAQENKIYTKRNIFFIDPLFIFDIFSRNWMIQ